MAAEAQRIEAALHKHAKGARRVVLDERGERRSTVQLAERLRFWLGDGARAAGGCTTVADPGGVRIARNFSHFQAGDKALGFIERLVGSRSLQRSILTCILLHELLTPLVLVNGTQFRHGLKLSSSNL